jgi:hypothetical protein
MDKIQFTSLLLEGGGAGPFEAPVPEFEGEPKFSLSPVSSEDKERWREQFKMCPRCGGLGMFPTDKRALTCPRCQGRDDQPSYGKKEIRLAVLTEILHGWGPDFLTVEGVAIPYSPTMVEHLATDQEAFYAILKAAEGLYKHRRTVEEGN